MKVEFMPGIASMSGMVKNSGRKRVIFRHYASDRPGHGHATICSSSAFVRKTPLTEREIAARELFSSRVSYVKQLCAANPRLSRAQAWKIAKADIRAVNRPPESIFLHGPALFAEINAGTHIVQVEVPDREEGRYPLCSRENAERYGLRIVADPRNPSPHSDNTITGSSPNNAPIAPQPNHQN